MEEITEMDFLQPVCNRWELQCFDLNWTKFVEALKVRVEGLLVKEPEKLIWILYRLDVPEEQFYEAMSLESKDLTVNFLVQKIIEREIKRYQFRKKYQG